ncbi:MULTISPECIES: hypothetical protein [Tenacibaculum]|uniref:hypothetical protein n=1 Tax=Tenacibaculum TaxID=104267 RepID=UPI001F0A85B2|nr:MULTISPECIES: hypothetical protein [Tenacibaculum]MCH3880766.1 hypothetical protein [Tenacibaculum aquimarinum]MDO6599635.1 hypothetical protein [Tenacibaculum sp. 1_MG-2023]
MKAVEIFKIRKSFSPNSSETIKTEAEDLINEKHYKGYRLVSTSFTVEGRYFYAFITMKKPNTY